MSQLRTRIESLTEQLNELLRELSATDDATARELVDEVLTTELMFDFKASVDAMRRLIWIYDEALAKVQSSGPGGVSLQRLNTPSTATLLQTLRASGKLTSLATSGQSFVEQVQGVVEKYVEVDAKDSASEVNRNLLPFPQGTP